MTFAVTDRSADGAAHVEPARPRCGRCSAQELFRLRRPWRHLSTPTSPQALMAESKFQRARSVTLS